MKRHQNFIKNRQILGQKIVRKDSGGYGQKAIKEWAGMRWMCFFAYFKQNLIKKNSRDNDFFLKKPKKTLIFLKKIVIMFILDDDKEVGRSAALQSG